MLKYLIYYRTQTKGGGWGVWPGGGSRPIPRGEVWGSGRGGDLQAQAWGVYPSIH